MLYIIQDKQKSLSQFSEYIAGNNKARSYYNKGMIADSYDAAELFSRAATQQLELNLKMFYGCLDTFRQQYNSSAHNPEYSTALTVNWEDFASEVAKQVYGIIDLKDTALKFIHRYNKAKNRWFLTVQICEITTTVPDAQKPNEYELNCMDIYFDIADTNSIEITDTRLLAGSVYDRYCPSYFSNIYYNRQHVDTALNAHSVIMAWIEFAYLFDHNWYDNSDRTNTSLFEICINAVASQLDMDDDDDALVPYPHCISAHLKYNGVDCLDNDDVVAGNFYNRAGDLNTICPPRCGVYAWPRNLSHALPTHP
ncbi:hypothetical protein CJD36_018690 [Flavipsychrobacter stenotrophus]|uniref:Uncharacterized protein n=1 Tax=Flavipsychrobacter stenotrophus TaxID=2077091 RepID=A0A2S7SRD6_9BACT|nr:hypothetical protein [Flavipsychrobacter stenotrophus]PQJ09278.1 hypothetical protein CJD36_018690 [Flavipsychrobacter stenotrophus]